MKVDFIFDFASPNAYCCHKVIPEIQDRTGIKFNYIHCLLGGIFKLTNNQAPMIQFSEIKNKLDYEGIEMERFMKKHSLDKFKMNSNFPITTVSLQRGALVAEEMGFVEEYRDKVLQAMWEDDINLGDQEIQHDNQHEHHVKKPDDPKEVDGQRACRLRFLMIKIVTPFLINWRSYISN